MAKIPTLMINSIGNASNIISSTFTVFFIPPPALLNDNLGGNILTYNESEDAYYVQHGADAVPKKLGSGNGLMDVNLSEKQLLYQNGGGAKVDTYKFTKDYPHCLIFGYAQNNETYVYVNCTFSLSEGKSRALITSSETQFVIYGMSCYSVYELTNVKAGDTMKIESRYKSQVFVKTISL